MVDVSLDTARLVDAHVTYVKKRKAWKLQTDYKRLVFCQLVGVSTTLMYGYHITSPTTPAGRTYLPDGAFRFYTYAEAREADNEGRLPDLFGFIATPSVDYTGSVVASEFPRTSFFMITSRLNSESDFIGDLLRYDRYYTSRKPEKKITFHYEARILKECGSRLRYP